MQEQLETLVQLLCPIMRFLLYIASGFGGVLLLLRLANAQLLRRLALAGLVLLILLNAPLGRLCARLVICVVIVALTLLVVLLILLPPLLLLLYPLLRRFRGPRGD